MSNYISSSLTFINEKRHRMRSKLKLTHLSPRLEKTNKIKSNTRTPNKKVIRLLYTIM